MRFKLIETSYIPGKHIEINRIPYRIFYNDPNKIGIKVLRDDEYINIFLKKNKITHILEIPEWLAKLEK